MIRRVGVLSGLLLAAVCMGAGCNYLSFERGPGEVLPRSRDAAVRDRDAGIPSVRDASVPLPDATVPSVPDADVRDAGVPDAAAPDADVPDDGSCRVDVFFEGERAFRLRETRALDGRVLRVDRFTGHSRSPDAWVEASAWDEDGRATALAWTDARFAVPILFRQESRRYRADGHFAETVVTTEDGVRETTRYVYDGDWLTRVEKESDGVSYGYATFAADLGGRVLRAEIGPTTWVVEWDEAGLIERWSEQSEAPGPVRCYEADVNRDADGNVLDHRERECGEAAAEPTMLHRYETGASTTTLETLDVGRLAGGFSFRRVWSRTEDRVDSYSTRGGRPGDPVVFDTSSFTRYVGCGAAPNRRALSPTSLALLQPHLAAAAPIEPGGRGLGTLEMVPTYRP